MAEKLYNLAEVAAHNTNKSAWLVIHNKVFDLTAFLNEHPGGEEVLIEHAGKDATEAFEDVGHSSDAREMMAKFKIGEIIEAERKVVPEKSEPNWSSEKQDDSSMKSWLIPILLGILVTIFYKYFFVQ